MIRHSLLSLAALAFGQPTLADTVAVAAALAAYDVKIAAVRAAAEGKGRALVVMTNGPKVATNGKVAPRLDP